MAAAMNSGFSGTLAMRADRWGNGVPKRNVRGAFDPCDRAARVRFGTFFFCATEKRFDAIQHDERADHHATH
jgi:hypothetical protein